MRENIESFLHYMSAERGSSRNTIAAYRNDLAGFAGYAAGRSGNGDGAGGAPAAGAIDRELLGGYVRWLGERSYAPATVSRKIAALRSFCGFLADCGDLVGDPAAALELPRPRKPLPKPLTTAEVDALLRQPLQQDTPEAIRDHALLELMYGTGMRVTEVVSLDLGSLQIDPRPGYVRCLGKGGKERLIPVGDGILDAAARYLDEARPALLRDRAQPALFVNRRGERLTRQGLWTALKGYARKAGIASHVTPHTLRHSFATHMLRGGASVRDVQELLGHSNVSTTQVYTRIADRHLQEAYEEAHPRARAG